MPEMNGIEFLKSLRAAHNTIPFIIFTGRGSAEVATEALKSGADFYLQKKGDPGAQYGTLQNMLLKAVRDKVMDA
jgi:DNA-binding NarL/FixJ family response regulator